MSNISRTLWVQAVVQSGSILLLSAILGLSVNHLRPGSLPLVADWSPEAQLQLDSGDSLMVPLDEAEAVFFAHGAVFLDARSRELFEEGHIEGALNLPWDDFDQRFDGAMSGIPRETPIVTYCDGEGCGLSRELAVALLGKGYLNVRVLVNGWTLWQEKGLPTARGLEGPSSEGAASPQGEK
jgi:rhodanese-related sulfurtransferase